MLSDNEQAVAYAFVSEAQEEFVNFLTGTGDIDLVDPELGAAAQKVGKLLEKAKDTLDV